MATTRGHESSMSEYFCISYFLEWFNSCDVFFDIPFVAMNDSFLTLLSENTHKDKDVNNDWLVCKTMQEFMVL